MNKGQLIDKLVDEHWDVLDDLSAPYIVDWKGMLVEGMNKHFTKEQLKKILDYAKTKEASR
jgi:hypothetical protein